MNKKLTEMKLEWDIRGRLHSKLLKRRLESEIEKKLIQELWLNIWNRLSGTLCFNLGLGLERRLNEEKID
jgi:hypothetical protein